MSPSIETPRSAVSRLAGGSESPTDAPIRLLIADDDEETRELLSAELAARGFQIVGGASNGVEAFQKACIVLPEVILMDVRMPELDGVAATALIKAQLPRTQIVILTAYVGRDTRWTAELMGAASLFDKDAPLQELADALRTAGHVARSYGP
jgi:DNA-binding NarL/FixJ family response regulator